MRESGDRHETMERTSDAGAARRVRKNKNAMVDREDTEGAGRSGCYLILLFLCFSMPNYASSRYSLLALLMSDRDVRSTNVGQNFAQALTRRLMKPAGSALTSGGKVDTGTIARTTMSIV